jgi:2-C-methyl-D-erythritol 4-phosphate cytidylyltransferase
VQQHAIIVAGGSGLRMKSTTPKQFLNLNGMPILMHTIKVFFGFNPNINIVLVLPEAHVSVWKQLIITHNFALKHHIVVGGKERFHSVLNGLNTVSDGIVGIHDGVRPLVSAETLKNCYSTAMAHGVAIPVTEVVESLREKMSEGTTSVDRAKFLNVQTPQCFDVKLLKACYGVGFQSFFTDDASVWEHAGNKVHVVAGNVENIKITNPSDLIFAEAILRSQNKR